MSRRRLIYRGIADQIARRCEHPGCGAWTFQRVCRAHWPEPGSADYPSKAARCTVPPAIAADDVARMVDDDAG